MVFHNTYQISRMSCLRSDFMKHDGSRSIPLSKEDKWCANRHED